MLMLRSDVDVAISMLRSDVDVAILMLMLQFSCQFQNGKNRLCTMNGSDFRLMLKSEVVITKVM